jgi:hypothetical protein
MGLTTRTVSITDEGRFTEESILDDLVPSRDADAFGALLRPAFGAETLLHYEPRTATITVAGYVRSLSSVLYEHQERPVSTQQRLLEKYRGATPPVPTVEAWTEAGEVSASGLDGANGLPAAFREAVEEADQMFGGADGITVVGFQFEAGRLRRFESWCPPPTSNPHRFVQFLYRLACQNLRSAEVEQRLAEVDHDLALGPSGR